jgi:hypothetical protein
MNISSKLAAPPSIPTQFHGLWDVKQQSCKNPTDDSDQMITIDAVSVRLWELYCKLNKTTKATDVSFTVNFSCESSDGSDKRALTFKLFPNGKLEFNKSNLVHCK